MFQALTLDTSRAGDTEQLSLLKLEQCSWSQDTAHTLLGPVQLSCVVQ